MMRKASQISASGVSKLRKERRGEGKRRSREEKLEGADDINARQALPKEEHLKGNMPIEPFVENMPAHRIHEQAGARPSSTADTS